jgi:hypothetical protein
MLIEASRDLSPAQANRLVISAATPYSLDMTVSVQRLRRLLSAALLGALMLATIAKPLAASVCETHQLGHTFASAGGAPRHVDSAAERQMDADHARGAHGLLHAGDEGSTYADIAAVLTVPAVRFESVPIALPTAMAVPTRHVGRPFRPPIA